MIIGLLSWWDEDPKWLTRAVVSLAPFVHHLVAVDGAYESMDGSYDRPTSPGPQADAVVAAADGVGLGLTLHIPSAPWVGDQIAKRTFVFRMADLFAAPGDWLFVVDADEIVTNVPHDLERQLEQAREDGFEAAIVEQSDLPDRGIQPSRRFYLHDPSLRVEGGHFRFVAGTNGDRRLVRGDERVEEVVPAATIRGFRFEHWSSSRMPYRRDLQRAYYRRRWDQGLEA
jgi:hypothetical protein